MWTFEACLRRAGRRPLEQTNELERPSLKNPGERCGSQRSGCAMQSMGKLGITAVVVAALALAAACGGGHASAIHTTQGLRAAPPAASGGGLLTAVGSVSLTPAPGSAVPSQGAAAQASPQQAPAIAYPWYFPAQSQTGLTVPGFGQAQAPADSAALTIFLGAQVVNPPTTGPSSGPIQPPQLTPVPDSDVQAVVDAITGQGVSANDLTIDRGTGTATLTVTVRHLDALDAIEQAATKAAQEHNLEPTTSVTYVLTDCASLEQAALRAAVSDANTRVSVLARALNVGVGAVAGAGYTIYPAFGADACESGGVVPYPVVNAQPATAAGAQAPEVRLSASVTVTFSIK